MQTTLRPWHFAVASAIVAALAWFLAPGPAIVPNTNVPPEAWDLPKAPLPAGRQSTELGAKANLWSKLAEAAASSQPPTDPRWRFVGIVTSGADRFVMIKVEGKPEQTLSVNDLLPGGSKILEIHENSLCILVDGKKRNLPLYQTGPQVI